MGSFLNLKKILEESDRLLLIGHEKPDGDCIGSLLAFSEALEMRGKTVDLACKDMVPEPFRYLRNWEKIKSDFLLGEYDAVILIDNGDMRRTGFSERLLSLNQLKTPIVNIDHHTKNDLWRIARVNYVNDEACASAILIYDILIGLKYEINPDIATALLTGIYNDTGGFQHTNTSSRVLNVVSDLLSRGAKLKNISDKISGNHSAAKLRLWGIALDRMIYNAEYGIIFSVITGDDIKKVNASEDEVNGIVNLINSAEEANIALLIYESQDGKIKGSLRTEKQGIDVSRLASLFGGGGHKKAAGFSIEGKIKKIDSGWMVV